MLPKALFLLLSIFFNAFSLKAHTVDYFSSCGYICAGSTVTVNARLSATATNTNYNWQFRDNSGTWKCFVNGNNTINGATFNVSNAISKGELTAAPTLTIANATTALSNVDVRILMVDGTNVSPCAANPSYPVYGGDKTLKLHVLTGTDCSKIAAYCSGGTPLLKLGDLIWNDIDGDGNKDADEPGTPGATVKLYADNNNDNTADGAAIATTTTNALGLYYFSNLKPANYIVGVIIPVGYTRGPVSTIDPDNNVNNDNNGVNLVGANQAGSEVRSKAITLSASGEPTTDGDDQYSNLTLDIALRGTSQLGDFVWNDKNANGIQDLNEPGLQGVNVKILFPDGVTTRTITTDANGKFLFTALATGTYKVTFSTPASFTPSAVNQGTSDAKDSDPVNGAVTVAVAAGTSNLTVDAGFFIKTNTDTGCVGNILTNASGHYGGFESGGSSISSTTAASDLYNGLPRNGSYQVVKSVNDLSGGGYLDIHPRTGNYFLAAHTSNDETDRVWYTKISVVPGATYNFCTYVTLLKNLGDGANYVLGLYANGTSIGTGRVTFDWTQICGTFKVPAGVTTLELSIRDPKKGLFFVAIDDICITSTPPVSLSLGNQVWNDFDGDGKRDDNEPGIPGAPISLYTDNNEDNLPDGAVIKTTTSDANGRYQFLNLAEGRYIVSMPVLPGYQQSPNTTTQDTSPFPNNDVDNDNNLVRLDGPNGPGGILYTNAITLSGNDEPTADGDGANGNNTLDLAQCGNAFIGDFVWKDLNGNGVQDAGEPGINGVVVTITFSDGTTATTKTITYNAANNQNDPQFDGYYNFPNLGPGTYKINFTTPAGLTPSPANSGGNDTKDSDPVDGAPITVILAANVSNFTIDAGFYDKMNVSNLTLGNQVWNDFDGDGKRDVNEPGIPGATISLYTDNNGDNIPDGAAIQTTTSDALGHYQFTGLSKGRYIASMPILPGYQQSPNSTTQDTSPSPDNNVDNDNNLVRLDGPNGPGGIIYTNAITLGNGEEPTDDGDDANGNNTFDLAQCGNSFIGDFVWNDYNGNGIQDAGEPGINGVLVTITFSDGTIATTTTETYNAANNPNKPQLDGYYNFPNLGPGTYKISFATPAGLHASPANTGDDTKDSDPVNGAPVTINLIADQSDFTVDAGFTAFVTPPTTPPTTCPNLSVGNIVFADLNGNGTKEVYEPGIGGLTVKLYPDNDGNNVADGVAISTLETAEDGTYYFGNLAAGKYIIGVTTGKTYTQGANSNANPNDNKDNDNNGVRLVNDEVFSNFITLSAGDEPINDGSDNNSNLTVDFGLKLDGTTTPCTTHCDCKNDCTHTGCGHSNCGHDSCKNDCKHSDCSHANCGHNSCKNDCKHTDCGHKNCSRKNTEGLRSASAEGTISVANTITRPELSITAVTVFPNPAKDYIIIKVMAVKEGKGSARITDLSGKLVATQHITLSHGMNLIKFDRLEGLRGGTYYAQVDFNYHIYNQQLIVVK
ncbi:hypothetical protein SAE01_25220 [Segetibacter aerophilus]|uniref:SD-repeat containing protein B domain-containing protein n=1 Tax=Segetibacter aerophilus TaxID=670293 RepID=A0A512BDI9_9BACT|nr:hypothetical protein SAE01_25220 [Segetibacter aerophilus]